MRRRRAKRREKKTGIRGLECYSSPGCRSISSFTTMAFGPTGFKRTGPYFWPSARRPSWSGLKPIDVFVEKKKRLLKKQAIAAGGVAVGIRSLAGSLSRNSVRRDLWSFNPVPTHIHSSQTPSYTGERERERSDSDYPTHWGRMGGRQRPGLAQWQHHIVNLAGCPGPMLTSLAGASKLKDG